MVDMPAALTPQTGRLPARDARDSGKVFPGGGVGRRRHSKQRVRWALPSVRASGQGQGTLRGPRSVRWISACPASWGEDGHSRAGCPGTTGLSAPGTVAPARGLCAPGTAHGRAPLAAVAVVTLAKSARGHSFRAAALRPCRTRPVLCWAPSAELLSSHWVLAASGSRETGGWGSCGWSRGRRCWRQVCCPCAGRRRDRFQGGGCWGGVSSRERCGRRGPR
jgi:hypothetical protein